MILRSLFILLAAAWACQPCLAAEGRKPNIILIMADDFGYECVGANGGESYATPNLDGLAAGGMRFDQCYVQPLCTPTRVQLMTGMYNVRNYIQFGLIDRDARTFAHPLKEAGYATGIAGKWQLGTNKKFPQRLGFDESYLWQHTRRPARYANAGLEHNGEALDFTNGEYGPDLVNDFAIDFVTRHKDEPFFLYYPMILTHGPYPPTPDSPDYDPKATKDNKGNEKKHFADMVTYMDKLVGRLIGKLDELGIRDNTLVIFLGDNGTGKEITSQWKGRSYPGGKGRTNSRGMHVPLIANWPSRVPSGKVNDDLVDSSDFLPTLCEVAGVDVPNSNTLDGRTFAPQLMGDKGTPREWIYSWYSHHGGPRAQAEFAMTKELKLYSDGRVFDLRVDPFEEKPLQASQLGASDGNTVKKLKNVLGQYADARPAEVASAKVTADMTSGKKGKGKKAGQKRGGKRRRAREAAGE
jgi:arylsulfatase A